MPTPLWTPPPELVERAVMTRYMHAQGFATYDELWRWSVDDLEAFWASIWDFFGVQGGYDRVLASREMPGAQWFPGAELNYADHLFRGKDADAVAILHASELRELGEVTWGELRAQAASMAARLRALGVGRGDRVAAYMPNIPETVAAFLATASLGAVWSSCSPDFPAGQPAFERVPFDHPLWVLYSSGTTGLPKAIVHGHGGILLEHLKKLNLHVDAQEADRIFWFTTTGWMMWNFVVGALLSPASIVLYDGSPGHPDMGVLWDLAERAGITCFGTSASYIAACMKAGVEPRSGRDLSPLRSIGSTGSPLSPEGVGT